MIEQPNELVAMALDPGPESALSLPGNYATPNWATKAANMENDLDISMAKRCADPQGIGAEEWAPNGQQVRKIHYEIVHALRTFDLEISDCSLVLPPTDWHLLDLRTCTRLFGMPVSEWDGTNKPMVEHYGTFYPTVRL